MGRSLRDRFDASYVVSSTGCWEWTKYLDEDGYGRTSLNGRPLRAPRVSFELHVAPIPTGLTIDHLCRNRRCVNPDHLEPVTHAENCRRREHVPPASCVNGHPYDETNTYIRPNGQRDCRRCIVARQQKARAKRLASAA